MDITIADLTRKAAQALLGYSSSPRLDAELLLCKVLGSSRSGLVVRGSDAIDGSSCSAYEELIARRRGGQPLAYLTGSREFWSLPLIVTPDVLVPRPETELLVELALARLAKNQAHSVLDLGTGSGAIALALASERPRARITAIDVSPQALSVAAHNSVRLGLARIDWRLGSWFEAVQGERFDLIVANPPYVQSGDPALRLLRAEPLVALASGPTGLEALTTIARRAARHLNFNGSVLLEHGETQAAAVARLLQGHGFTCIGTHLDYSGRPRVTLGSLRSSHSRSSHQEYS